MDKSRDMIEMIAADLEAAGIHGIPEYHFETEKEDGDSFTVHCTAVFPTEEKEQR